jgi:hypothetical protein
MLRLPTVTLVAVDSLHTYLTSKALRHIMQYVNFKRAYLFTSDFTTKVIGLTVVPIPEARSIIPLLPVCLQNRTALYS